MWIEQQFNTKLSDHERFVTLSKKKRNKSNALNEKIYKLLISINFEMDPNYQYTASRTETLWFH